MRKHFCKHLHSSLISMPQLGGGGVKLTALAYHPTKKVNKTGANLSLYKHYIDTLNQRGKIS
jgi:hypothetical protein